MTNAPALAAPISAPRATDARADRARKDAGPNTPTFASVMRAQRANDVDQGRAPAIARDETRAGSTDTAETRTTGNGTPNAGTDGGAESQRLRGLSALHRRDWHAHLKSANPGEDEPSAETGAELDAGKTEKRVAPKPVDHRGRTANSNQKIEAAVENADQEAPVSEATSRPGPKIEDVEAGKAEKPLEAKEAPPTGDAVSIDAPVTQPDTVAKIHLASAVSADPAEAEAPTQGAAEDIASSASPDDTPLANRELHAAAKPASDRVAVAKPASEGVAATTVATALDQPQRSSADVLAPATKNPAAPATAQSTGPRQPTAVAASATPQATASAQAAAVTSRQAAPLQQAIPPLVTLAQAATGLQVAASATPAAMPAAISVPAAATIQTAVAAAMPTAVSAPAAFTVEMTVAAANYALASGKPSQEADTVTGETAAPLEDVAADRPLVTVLPARAQVAAPAYASNPFTLPPAFLADEQARQNTAGTSVTDKVEMRGAEKAPEDGPKSRVEPEAAPAASARASSPVTTPAQPAPASPVATVVAAIAADPATRPRAVAQLAHALTPQAGAEPKTITIQLHPAELGVVYATFQMTGGQMSVEISAETQEARERLSAESRTIAKSLRTLGIEVEQVTVMQTAPTTAAVTRTDDAAAQNMPANRDQQQSFGAQTSGGGGSRLGGQQNGRNGHDMAGSRLDQPSAAERGDGGVYI